MPQKISAASYSRYNVFQQCKYRAKLSAIDKIPEPDRGPPPRGQKEWANDRGSRVHKEAEEYVQGIRTTISPELKHFATEISCLRTMFKEGKVRTEETWFFDAEWQPVSGDVYEEIALRIICDVTVFLSPVEAVIIDHKTGQKYGNEVSHAQQMQLYQLAAFIKYPTLETVTVELWYLDQDEITSMTFRRSQGIRFFRSWDDKFKAMLACTSFPPNANIYSCKWCPYRQDRSGHCSFGIY